MCVTEAVASVKCKDDAGVLALKREAPLSPRITSY